VFKERRLRKKLEKLQKKDKPGAWQRLKAMAREVKLTYYRRCALKLREMEQQGGEEVISDENTQALALVIDQLDQLTQVISKASKATR
jgi:hypothetical protein